MADAPREDPIEEQIEQWRAYLRRRQAGQPVDLAVLERQLRGEMAGLTRAGLAGDEAFLVALKRLSRADSLTREFAREHSSRAWKQLIPSDSVAHDGGSRREGVVAFCLAVLAAVALKSPELFGVSLLHDGNEPFYARNAALFVLPCVIAYFAWKRRLAPRTLGGLAGAFGVAAIFANLPGWGGAHAFEQLTALHLPIALWLAVGIAYAGGRWGEVSGRMDFIRFSGELVIYFALLALGGGVLCAFTALTFKSIGINVGPFFGAWLLPCGAAGAVVIASWLVEARQGVIESIAPLLTRIFTPLFATMLVAFLGTLVFSGRGIAIERHLLIGFDLLLVVVLGLLLYSISSRDPQAPPGAFDGLQVVLLVSALLADVVALCAIGARIGEFGFSANRVAALGENVILLINLAWSAVLYARWVLKRGTFASLERWQTGYVPLYAAWAALVVIVFPLLFPHS